MEDRNPLDAYSQIVTRVAERLTPKVASLRVPRAGQGGQGGQGYGRGESLGSGVVFTGDGFLLTNAHVVGESTAGDRGVLRRHVGTVPRGRARTRCPTWRCCAPTAPPRSPPSSARPTS